MIPPGSTLGLIGGGQLGRMFTTRARSMGYDVVVLDPDPESPTGSLATRHLQVPYDDWAALEELARTTLAVTVEFENVSAPALEWLGSRVPCRPAASAVAVAQDRIREKTFLETNGFATAPFEPVATLEALRGSWERLGPPALLKTSRLGYDGKGQAVVDSLAEAESAFTRFGGAPCVLERRLSLELEVSVVLARGSDGAAQAFPVGENVHRNGILHTTVAPARIPEQCAEKARAVASAVAASLEYVGVLGVEMFIADGGRLFVNEIAPRPHNSGHYTLDACVTSQFEQQVRALAELPLGSPALLSPVCMINLLGDLWTAGEPRWDRALAFAGVTLHLYGKTTARPGRKMGHLNCIAGSPDQALALAERAFAALTSNPL